MPAQAADLIPAFSTRPSCLVYLAAAEQGIAALRERVCSLEHLGVEVQGSIELISDDLDVVDPLEDNPSRTFVDRDPPVVEQFF